MSVEFYLGIFNPAHAKHFERVCISANRLRRRRKDFVVRKWIMDSGAFTEVSTFGHYRDGVRPYANLIRRWRDNGEMQIAVAQDFMCEPWIIKKTGLSIGDHQRLTIDRYDALCDEGVGVTIMPVLQGFAPDDYSRHVEQYGNRLTLGAWVGVGSVCKRNGSPVDVMNVLAAIRSIRPDLRLHGFGIKKTSLDHGGIRSALATADSMAWSFSARKQGRDGNSWEEAARWLASTEIKAARAGEPWQANLPL